MFVTVVVLLCHLQFGAQDCFEEIVTDSTMTDGLTFMDCMAGGQAPLAKWKSEHPIYRNTDYSIGRYKCVPGHYVLQGRA